MAVMEVILKAIDQVSPVMDKVQGATGKATGFMEKNWLKVGAAATALAGGIEVMYKKQAPLIESSRKLASSLDMTEGAVRAMAIEVSNVTFPLESVFNIMETGRQQGIKSAEQLKDYAAFWDKVGDATGENADSLAEASSALRAVGVAAGEEGEKLDKAFGYIVKETTGSIGEFLTFLGKCGPELREMGMSVDDSAAILGALEREFGMTAMVARTEFRQAVNEADGDMEKLYETLGLTEEQVKKYQDQLQESGGVIDEFARINNETMYTSLDKIKHAFGELSLKFSPVLEGLAKFSPVLMAVGPAMKGISMASKGLGQAVGLVGSGFTTAISGAKSFIGLAMTNPLTPWIVAIMAVVAAIVLIYKNWDKIVEFFKTTIEIIKKIFGEVAGFISEVFSAVWDKTIDTFSGLSDKLGNVFSGLKDSVAEIFGSIGDFIGSKMQWIVDKCIGVWDGFVDKLKAVWSGLTEALKGFVNIFINAINWIIGALNKFKVTIPEWVPKLGGKTWGFNIPKIPTLHEGGVFRAPEPGGEGLALLRDKEIVSTPQQAGGMNISISPGAIQINTQKLDDREINRVGDKLMDVIISKSRAYNLRFAR